MQESLRTFPVFDTARYAVMAVTLKTIIPHDETLVPTLLDQMGMSSIIIKIGPCPLPMYSKSQLLELIEL